VRERELAAPPPPPLPPPMPTFASMPPVSTPQPEPEPEPAPPPPPPPEPEPAPAPALVSYEPEAPGAPDGPGRWNVLALDRLVEQRGHEFPDRIEEWTSYLYSLRAYASPDGTLPPSFDGLVQETFRELV